MGEKGGLVPPAEQEMGTPTYPGPGVIGVPVPGQVPQTQQMLYPTYNSAFSPEQNLELLSVLKDGMTLHQEIEMKESIAQMCGCCYESNNRYALSSLAGEKAAFAKEQTGFWMRVCCMANRSAALYLIAGSDVDQDNYKDKAAFLNFFRPFRCWGCMCFPCNYCCSNEMETYLGHDKETGTPFGKISQNMWGGGLRPVLDLEDGQGVKKLRVIGPWLVGQWWSLKFRVVRLQEENGKIVEGSQVAMIKKKIADLGAAARAAFTDSDHFEIKYEATESLDSSERALILGATFLLDFMFFEFGPAVKRNNDGIMVRCATFYCCGCRFPCYCQAVSFNNHNHNNYGGW